jgi:serine protease Do
MKHFRFSNLAALGALLLTSLATPGALPSQAAGQSAAKPVPPAAPSGTPFAPSGIIDQRCGELTISTEQFDNLARTIDRELKGKLANLQERLAQEAVMSSPELAKLQDLYLSAQLEGKQGEIESKAAELAANAQELAAQVRTSTPHLSALDNDISIVTTDEGDGWLGIEISEVTADAAKEQKLSSVRGVVVKGVEPDSPAAKAGLKESDVITQYDGQPVEGTVQFRRLVRETPPGRNVVLVISRNGASQNVSVEVGEHSTFFGKKMEEKMRDFGHAYAFTMPAFDFNFAGPCIFGEVMDSHAPVLGISAEDLTGQLGSYFGAPDDKGILVREVRSGTPAEKAGLKAGDVIVKLDGKPIHALAELREQLRSETEEKPFRLGILRKGSEMSVSVTIEKPHPAEPMHRIHRAQL